MIAVFVLADSFRSDAGSQITKTPPRRIFNNMIQSEAKYIDAIFMCCRRYLWGDIWYAADVFIFITGFVADAALLWLFVRERKSLSASKVSLVLKPAQSYQVIKVVLCRVGSAGL